MDGTSARLEWLKWRQGGLGGSDIMQILLEDEHRPYGGPWDVWVSKTQEIGIDQATEAQAIGNWLEKPIADWVGVQLGRVIEEAEPVQGPKGWMRCTPDFWMVGEGEREGLECKVSFKSSHWADGVPPYVLLQALWCMLCTDTEVWHVGAFLPMQRKRGNWLVHRDERLEQAVLGMTREWWQKHVLGGEPPPIDGSASCAAGLQKLYPEIRVDELVTADEGQDALITELVDLNQMLKDGAMRKREIINHLTSAIGDSRGIQGACGAVKWDQRKGTTRLDSKALKVAMPEVWARFAKTGEPSRSARVVPVKEGKNEQ